MRFIKTTQVQVETLRKRAKHLQRNEGGKHPVLLDRVALGAAYDLKLCLTETEQVKTSRQLLPEIEGIVQAALDGICHDGTGGLGLPAVRPPVD